MGPGSPLCRPGNSLGHTSPSVSCSPFFPGGEAGLLQAAVPRTKGQAPEEEPGTWRTHQGLLQPPNRSHQWDCVTQTGELERKPALFASSRSDGSQQVLEELWGVDPPRSSTIGRGQLHLPDPDEKGEKDPECPQSDGGTGGVPEGVGGPSFPEKVCLLTYSTSCVRGVRVQTLRTAHGLEDGCEPRAGPGDGPRTP